MVKLVRVDDRFIHGQILESWIPYLDAEVVLVVNDDLANDSFQKTIMSLALPDKIELQIVPVDAVCKYITEYADNSVFVITSSITDAYRIHAMGVSYPCLNLGNMGMCECSRQFSYSVWIDEMQISLIEKLIAVGLPVTLQSVPREQSQDMAVVIEGSN